MEAGNIVSRLLHYEPYIAEKFILPFLNLEDFSHLHQLNKVSNAMLSPSEPYCPIFASIFEKYTGEVFDESLDWKEQIKFVQESTESFSQVMITAKGLLKK